MQFEVASILGLVLVATCIGAPLNDITGLDLTPGNTSFWNKDFVIGDQTIQVGLGWQKETGRVGAGAKMLAKINGKEIPISAALGSNTNDWKDVEYELGANVEDTVSAVISGDLTGNVLYEVNGVVPIKAKGVSSSIGASLIGSGIDDNILTAGIGLGKEVVQAQIGLNGLVPALVNVQVGANTE